MTKFSKYLTASHIQIIIYERGSFFQLYIFAQTDNIVNYIKLNSYFYVS